MLHARRPQLAQSHQGSDVPEAGRPVPAPSVGSVFQPTASALQLCESCDHASRDDFEHLFDDAIAFRRMSAEGQVALRRLAAGQGSEGRTRNVEDAIVRAQVQTRDREPILDTIVAARAPLHPSRFFLQHALKVFFQKRRVRDICREVQPIQVDVGATLRRLPHGQGPRWDRVGRGFRLSHTDRRARERYHEPGEPALPASQHVLAVGRSPPEGQVLSARGGRGARGSGALWPGSVQATDRLPMVVSLIGQSAPDVDVIVIGGGVNGTGVARDATLRGLKVALFERNDIGFGASGNSSGMIHGGPRYLTQDPDVTYTSCLDSGHIQRIAPHLLFRIPFLMPVFGGSGAKARAQLAAYDAFFGLYDKYQKLKSGKPHVRLSADEVKTLEPGLIESAGGVTFDEWGIDGVRLCVGNLVDAIERGARAHVHCTVTSLLRRDDGSVYGVSYDDRRQGCSGKLTARAVVNATGAWAPLTAALGGVHTRSARVRPGKGIHVFLDRRLTNYAVIATAIDGRQVFLLPWQNMSVLGTTDDDYYGDLDDVVATSDEVRYLFQAVERVFPSVQNARSIGTWGGVRPTLYEWGPGEDELSRDHRVVDHAAEGADGLYSMVGGKLASFRLFAEEMTDVLARRLGNDRGCQTHVIALPGGEEQIAPMRLVREGGMEAVTATRLEYRHGSRSLRVLERMAVHPREAAVVCPCEPVTEAEIRYVVEHEMATTVEDVSRRTRLGLGACGGMRCAARCGRIVAEMTGASAGEGLSMAFDFLRAAAKRRVSGVGPEQARQEALILAMLRSEVGVAPSGFK